MSTVETRYEHVVLNENGVPIIAGTTMKVKELVLEHIHYNWSAEELQVNHPYLSLAQVYSALAYYYNHKAEIDEDIERGLKYVEEMRRLAKTQPDPLRERLRAKGYIK